jgi:hypothetical protein
MRRNNKLEFYFFLYQLHEIIINIYLADNMDIYEATQQTRFVLSELSGLSVDRIRHIYYIVKNQKREVKNKYIAVTNKRINLILEIFNLIKY